MKKKPKSPAEKISILLHKWGVIHGNVEKKFFVPGKGPITKDFLDVIDIIAITPALTVGIQACMNSPEDINKHKRVIEGRFSKHAIKKRERIVRNVREFLESDHRRLYIWAKGIGVGAETILRARFTATTMELHWEEIEDRDTMLNM